MSNVHTLAESVHVNSDYYAYSMMLKINCCSCWYLVRVGKTFGSRQRQYQHWLHAYYFLSKEIKTKFSLGRNGNSFACRRRIEKWLLQTHKYSWDTIRSCGIVPTNFSLNTLDSSFAHCSIGKIENEVNAFFRQLPFDFMCKFVIIIVLIHSNTLLTQFQRY